LKDYQKGQMEYNNDYLLPVVTGIVQQKVAAYNNLSQSDKNKILSLTEAQLKSLRDTDQQAKKAFLQTEPKTLDPNLRRFESVRKSVRQLGKVMRWILKQNND